jgi:predicted house-cleaning NTP pyrophosphatase (Maf/HAM1 superfamily)
VDICNIAFNEISDEIIQNLVAKREIFHCSGALRIEDQDLFPLVKKIDGNIYSISICI